MRILFVADGRSPIALNWISYFVQAGHEVHLVSTFPCQPELRLSSLEVIPVAFGGVAGMAAQPAAGSGSGQLRRLLPVGLRTAIRQWFGPLSLSGAARRFAQVAARIQPDLVHAMRIPYEGMLAALGSDPGVPLLVSVWGNDFTLHAPSNPLLARYTRLALRRANALHADCQRDIRLAPQWGFEAGKPAVVLPGGGGVQLDLFYPLTEGDGVANQSPLVVNPRGFRAYVENKAFFQAIPWVLESHPQVRFACPAMVGEAQALRWLEQMNLAAQVELLPRLTRQQMADLFRRAQVEVSPTTHDGTPNTLLEAMACGCFPIAGDLESLREWITPGQNGLLVDPRSPRELAQAMITALSNSQLRLDAREQNTRLVAERADYRRVMEKAEAFYSQL
jgi:glycosyltransferase involved in cell wall biosynthesis